MSRPGNWTLVDGDPAPGRPDGIRRKGDVFEHIGEVAGQARTELQAIKDRDLNDVWEGEAADRFAGQVEGEFLGNLKKLDESFNMAGHALQDYATELAELQEEADQALRRATQADQDEDAADHRVAATSRDVASAQKEVQRWNNEVQALNREYYTTLSTRRADDTTYDTRYANWKRRYEDARQRVLHAQNQLAEITSRRDRATDERDDARQSLKRARDQISDIKERRERAEKEAADDLHQATELGIKNKGFWDKVKDTFDAAMNWIADNIDVLDNVLGWISTVAGVLALCVGWIPVIGQIAAGALIVISVTAQVLKALVNIVAACKGKRSWTTALFETGMAVVDVATMGMGSKAVKGGKAAVAAAKVSKSKTALGALSKLADSKAMSKVVDGAKWFNKTFDLTKIAKIGSDIPSDVKKIYKLATHGPNKFWKHLGDPEFIRRVGKGSLRDLLVARPAKWIGEQTGIDDRIPDSTDVIDWVKDHKTEVLQRLILPPIVPPIRTTLCPAA